MNRNTIIYTIIFSVIFCISGNGAFSQLKVMGNNGKVILGTVPSESSQIYVEDFDKILSASIFGKGENYRSGAKLSFGDFGRWDYLSWNVFIGEWGSTDTDQLWLHGKYGFYLTYGRAEEDYYVMWFDAAGRDNRLHLNTELFAQGVKIPANESSQQNADIIKSSLERINYIDGITYQYKFFNNTSTPSSPGISDKEIRDQEFFNNLNEEMNNYAPQKNGFKVNQLKEFFPELVETDKDGNNYIDYTGLIPVLVEAIKEQSRIITAQSLKLKEMGLLTEVTTMGSSSADSNFTTKSTTTTTDTSTTSGILANAFLYQNTPNPFNTTTEIKYFLPEGSKNAYIYVFNLQGNLLFTYNLNDNGFGSIMINGSSLNAGMYIYSLVINGKEAETKRMILTK